MRRRSLLLGALAFGTTCGLFRPTAPAQSPQPFRIVIRREYSLADLVGSASSTCTYGRLWAVAPARNLVTEPILPQEQPVCETLELPHRGNSRCISQIPNGTYKAAAELHKELGWSIRLADVPGRSGVLIHAGNSIEQTDGCILVGTDRHPKGKCDCFVRDPAKKPIYDNNGCRVSGGPTTAEIGKACAAAGIALPGSKKALAALRGLYGDPTLKRPVNVTVIA
jgi:hypothetical protein